MMLTFFVVVYLKKWQKKIIMQMGKMKICFLSRTDKREPYSELWVGGGLIFLIANNGVQKQDDQEVILIQILIYSMVGKERWV